MRCEKQASEQQLKDGLHDTLYLQVHAAGEVRKEGRVHVEAPPGPVAAEGGRQDPHVAHAEDQVHPRVFQRRRHLRVELLARAVLSGQAGRQEGRHGV